MRLKVILATLLAASVTTISGTIQARDTTHRFPVADPMATSTAEEFDDVQFYFGDESHPQATRSFGVVSTQPLTNAFMKSDKEACDWVFLSAVKSLYERALQEGGNAVVDIKSITTGQPVSSTSEYVCRAGNVVAKVYLEGKIIVIE